MTRHRHVKVYRALTALYPRSFRHDYREDLAVLFSHQITEEPAVRVWLRTLRDFAVTVPARHLEARMHRPPTAPLVIICAVMTAASLAMALVIGTGILFVLIAVVPGSVGVWAWRAEQPVDDPGSYSAEWWKFLAGGVLLITSTFAGMAIPWPAAIDLGDNAYWLVICSMMSGFVLVGAGVLLGLAAMLRHHRSGPTVHGAT